MSQMKRCSKCKQWKDPIEGFHKNNTTKDGRQCQCKSCLREYQKANRHKIAEREAARRRAKGVKPKSDKPIDRPVRMPGLFPHRQE